MKYLLFACFVYIVWLGFQPSTARSADALSSVQVFDYLNERRPANTSNTLGRRYIWNFQGNTYTVLMEIDVEGYNAYAARERSDIPEMIKTSTEEVGALASEFERLINHKGWDKATAANFVLTFVQSLPYTHDDVTTGYDEFRRYAIETLIEGGGDCEDTTILGCALLSCLAFPLALVRVPGHIALAIAGNFPNKPYYSSNGENYFYCETTGTGWTVGDIPREYTSTKVELLPLSPSAVPPHRLAPVIQPPTPAPSPQPKPFSPPKPSHVTDTAQNDEFSNQIYGVLVAIVFCVILLFVVLRILTGKKSHREEPLDDINPRRKPDDFDRLI